MTKVAESMQVAQEVPIRSATPSGGALGRLDGATASLLVSDHGSTIIHHDVVAKIAGVAIREIHGVHALVPYGAGQKVSAFARRITGAVMRELGVQVEVGHIQAAVDVRIVADYGSGIVEIARNIRHAVREQIERMTGLEVVEVNVEVVDLYFQDAGKDPPRSGQRQLA